MAERYSIDRLKKKGKGFLVIAGPCVIENEKLCLKTARALKRITDRLNLPFVFKSSYDKANRTSIRSFRGPGIEKGLRILRRIRDELGVKVITDIHSVDEAERAAEVVDILQVPAFLCRQTDIITAAGRTGRTVNVKKGQFISPGEVRNIIDKLESSGCRKIMITERGSSFGYNNLVVDFRSIPMMQEFGYPVLFDATHSVQLPGGRGDSTGGDRRFVPYLARAAVACGADGIFMEVHPHPARSLSDSSNIYPLGRFEELLSSLKEIRKALV